LTLLLVSVAGTTWYAMRTPPAPLGQPARALASQDLALDTEERRLVNGAEAALASADTDHAFALLYEHATKFPSGKLAALRQVVHVEALCRVGKAAEAREEAANFLEKEPNSPLAVRVRGQCASPP